MTLVRGGVEVGVEVSGDTGRVKRPVVLAAIMQNNEIDVYIDLVNLSKYTLNRAKFNLNRSLLYTLRDPDERQNHFPGRR
ncbi:MAG: hypothetical protein PSV40_00120 [Polaromonas sp.]|uniref:hypothetical protein n=1 Tax=Polaromonas sp. TaxID=1869339 RepID=UPI002487B631|nr:hypothetical protein [Polaromonas sp.]MDI1267495.1 hypothetical protein [Polaromonas sp.]